MAVLRDCVQLRTVCRLVIVLSHVGIAASVYINSECQYNGQSMSASCAQEEVIRVRQTILSDYTMAPDVPLICESPYKNPYCNAPSNRSDREFVGRQSASFPIPAEELYPNLEKRGKCEQGVRSRVAQLFYECVPTSGSYLQSICSDILWENEVSGYLTNPGFPNNFPDGERTCQCELRPAEGSRVELVAVLMNPSTSGTTWTLQAEGVSYTQDLSTQSYVSRVIPLVSGSGTIKLVFRSQGSGGQRPTISGPPAGFWLEYRAVQISSSSPVYTTSNPGSLSNQYEYQRAGRVTLICNDPYDHSASAGVIAGVVIAVVLLVLIIAVGVFCYWRKRKRDKGESYLTDRPPPPHVYSGKGQTNKAMQPSPPKEKQVLEEDDDPPHYIPYSHRSREIHEKEGVQGRAGRGRASSNTSSMDKVFVDDLDRKSVPSSGRTGDDDSIAKKSLSQDSQADAYSDVNYNPNYGVRLSAVSLGKDTAV